MGKLWKIAVPLLIILAPIAFILFLNSGRNEYKKLPYLGTPEDITEKGDTLYHRVPYFRLTDQYGKPYGTPELEGQIYVADFFFTRCPNICPVMTESMKRVQKEFKQDKGLQFVSFTLDAKHDTVEALYDYAEKYGVNNTNWRFLTGPQDTIFRLMNQEGFLVVRPLPDDDPAKFQHSELLVLVDREGHVRGHYNGTDYKDVGRLIDEIKVLHHEYATRKGSAGIKEQD